MWHILYDDEDVHFIYDSDALNDYLRTSPAWLQELSAQDFRFMMELQERVGGRAAARMIALYLDNVCDLLDIAAVFYYDIDSDLALMDREGGQCTVLDADLLLPSVLETMQEVASAAA
jgi:hypothetical protein